MLVTGGQVIELTRGHTAVILHMGSPTLVGRDIELPCYLPISAGHTVVEIIEVDEEKRISPSVRFVQFCGGRDAGTSCEAVAQRVAKVIVQLHILRRHDHGHKE